MNGVYLTGLSLSLAVSLSLTTPSALAATLTYDLTFVNGRGNLVGTGEFSYNPGNVVVVRSPAPYSSAYVAGKDDPIRPDYIPAIPGLWQVITYPNPLTNFVARLPGRDWSFGDLFLSWWNPDAPTTVNSFGCSRAGCGITAQWFGGSALGVVPGQFAMFGGRLQGEDTYTGSFISAVIPATPNSFVGGTWTATPRSEAVPEPATILGAIAFGTGCWLYRAQRQSDT